MKTISFRRIDGQPALQRRFVASWLMLGPVASGGCAATDGTSAETEKPADATTMAATDAGCAAGRTTVDDCCCFTEVPGWNNSPTLHNDCPIPEAVCASISYDTEAGVFADPTAITCSLKALRDGATGSMTWYASSSVELFYVDLYPQGDGTAFVVRGVGNDLGFEAYRVGQVLLKPPAYFDGCLALGSTLDRYYCLQDFDQGVPMDCIDSSAAPSSTAGSP